MKYFNQSVELGLTDGERGGKGDNGDTNGYGVVGVICWWSAGTGDNWG